MKEKMVPRRHFFKHCLAGVLDILETPKEEKQKKPQQIVRPPGSLENEKEFLATCEKCQKCAQACPYGVIKFLGEDAKEAAQTPILDLENTPCRWCADMPCIQACPSGALRFSENQKVPPLGKASINLEHCLTTQGILCDECATVCPTSIRAITMSHKKPQLNIDACVGCGLCSFYCHAEPIAIKLDLPSREKLSEN